jgi:hypothetical protein
MTKWLTVVLFATMAAACASDDNGGGGSGDDSLPKRGELSTDPTIVSAAARCTTNGITPDKFLVVDIRASDPMGETNLGSCAMNVGSATDQSGFSESGCYLDLRSVACQVGSSYTVGITVSNSTGGVTTASVTLAAAE